MTATALNIDASWQALQHQRDMDWELEAITDRCEAIAFLRRFENHLCIYSSYVEKLYSHYSFVVPQDERGGITILPDELAWHDTFHDIPVDAVEPTVMSWKVSTRKVLVPGKCPVLTIPEKIKENGIRRLNPDQKRKS